MADPDRLDVLTKEILEGGSLADYAAGAAVGELVTNWKAALSDGTPIEKLVDDVDDVIRKLSQFKEKALQAAPNPASGP